MQFLIPSNASLLEIGWGTGDLIQQISSKKVMGIDISMGMIGRARQKYPHIRFEFMDAENLE